MTKAERQELDQEIEKVSNKIADDIRNNRQFRSRKAEIVKEPDQFIPNLILIEKNKGEPWGWIYGPYMIGAASKPNWAWASLLIGTEVFGKEVYFRLPLEFDSMPFGKLLDKIDQALLGMKNGRKKK